MRPEASPSKSRPRGRLVIDGNLFLPLPFPFMAFIDCSAFLIGGIKEQQRGFVTPLFHTKHSICTLFASTLSLGLKRAGIKKNDVSSADSEGGQFIAGL